MGQVKSLYYVIAGVHYPIAHKFASFHEIFHKLTTCYENLMLSELSM